MTRGGGRAEGGKQLGAGCGNCVNQCVEGNEFGHGTQGTSKQSDRTALSMTSVRLRALVLVIGAYSDSLFEKV